MRNLLLLFASVPALTLLAACNPMSGGQQGSSVPAEHHPGLASIAFDPQIWDGSLTTEMNQAAQGQLIGSIQSGAPLSFSIQSEPTKGKVTLTNASTGDFTYTPHADVTGSDFFTYLVKAGGRNSGIATFRITIKRPGETAAADTTAPEVTGLLNDPSPTQSKSWSWGCSESGCTYRFVIDTLASTNPTGAYGATASTTQNSGTGTYFLHVQAKDAAGNESAVIHVSAALDHTAPAVSSVSVHSALSVDVTFSEAMGSGVTNAANYTVSGTGQGTLAAHPDSVALVTGNQYRLSWSSGEMLSGQDITISVANVQDAAGNVIASSGTHTGGAIGNAPSVTGISNDSTPTKSKSWTWGCSKSSCTYRYVIDTTSNTAPSGAYGSTTTAAQNSGTGTYYLHVQAKDSVGNESAVVHASAELDNTAPSAPSGLALQTPSTSPGNDTTPTIRVSGVSSGDTVTLHTASDCSLASLQATGTASGTTIDLTVGSALSVATYAFYAKTVDAAGNASGCSSASVSYEIDTSAPTVSIASLMHSSRDADASSFGAATLRGVAWNSGTSSLKLANSGGCNGTAANCSELDSSWTPQWSSLVSYWKMDNDWVDSKGGHNGTPQGSPSFTTASKIGTHAATFNGTQYVNVGNYFNPTATLTTSAWVKTTATNTGYVINQWSNIVDTNASQAFTLAVKSTGVGVCQINALNGADYDLSGVKVINDGAWHWIACTVDKNASGNNINLYVDGVWDSGFTVGTNIIATTTDPLYLGCGARSYGNAYCFNGSIDEVAIWSVPLTASEIRSIYDRQSARYAGSIVSRVLDAGASRNWSSLAWLPTLPFLKELPDFNSGSIQNESSQDYPNLVGSTGSTSDNDLMSGIKALWHFNEAAATSGTGNDFRDDSGNGNHAELTGGTATFGADGKLGKALQLNGSTSILSAPLPHAQTTNLTVSGWYYWKSASASSALFYFGNSGANGYGLWISNGACSAGTNVSLLLGGATCNGLTSNYTMKPSTWTHLALTRSGTTWTLYANGLSVATGTASPGTPTGLAGIGGNSDGDGKFNGLIDEMAVWNRALHAQEVKQLYLRGASRLKFQARSCDDSACSGESWTGPDGTSATYFSELNNNSVPLDSSGDVWSQLPSLPFASFTSPTSANRFFQYRAILESDDADITLAPELKRVTVNAASSASQSLYTSTGTCSDNGQSVTVTVTDGTHSATGTTTCVSGSYTATIDVSSLDTGSITASAAHTDAAGNIGSSGSTVSASNDTSPPSAPTSLGWVQSDPTTSTSLTASWTVSVSADLMNQKIQFYTGSSCNTPTGSLINLGSKTTNGRAFTATAGANYSYRITSVDSAGNESASPCSTAIHVSLALASGATFDSGTESSYVISDSSKLELSTGGVCHLKPIYSFTDSDFVSSGFAGGSFRGVAWSGSSALTLKADTDCDGDTSEGETIATNCEELDPSWTPKWASLVSYWKMNGDWNDSKGTNHGTPENGVTFATTPKIGSGAGLFDASNDRVTIANESAFRLTSMTLAAWVKIPNTAGWRPFLSKDNGNGATRTFYLGLSDGTSGYGPEGAVTFLAKTPAGADDLRIANSTVIDNDQWHHVIATADGTTGTAALYIDGVLMGTDTFTTPLYTGSEPFYLHALHWSVAQMLMDDVAVWSTALTAAEAQAIYRRQSPRYSGTFTSRVIDNGSAQSWTQLTWSPTLPFMKELPDYSGGSTRSESSADYPLLVGSTGSTSDNNLMSGIKGLWHLNESAATAGSSPYNDFKDDSGNANAGEKSGGVDFGATGRFAGAASFDGSGSIAVADHAALRFGTGDFTISLWLNTSQASSFALLTRRSGDGTAGWYLGSQTSTNLLFYSHTSTTNACYSATVSVRDGYWHHLTVTRTSNTIAFYVDGVAKGTCANVNSNFNNANSLLFGKDSSVGDSLVGRLDEVALWNRALHADEVKQLYRRGASSLKFQVRSCDDSACSGESWQGPDGTSGSYFSELNNNTTGLDGSGDVKTSRPELLFSQFTSPPAANRYFQYRAILEGDDADIALGPELKQVSGGPASFDTSVPSIHGKAGISFYALTGFTETLGTSGCAGGVRYTLSKDKTAWYYWNGSTWTISDGSDTQANDASTVNANIAAFGTQLGNGSVYFKAFLRSNGAQACELDAVSFTGLQ